MTLLQGDQLKTDDQAGKLGEDNTFVLQRCRDDKNPDHAVHSDPGPMTVAISAWLTVKAKALGRASNQQGKGGGKVNNGGNNSRRGEHRIPSMNSQKSLVWRDPTGQSTMWRGQSSATTGKFILTASMPVPPGSLPRGVTARSLRRAWLRGERSLPGHQIDAGWLSPNRFAPARKPHRAPFELPH
jgi:hypothetical protein